MNKLYFGDCLDVLKKLHAENPQGFIDLIYIDPPFNSKRNYNILFEDIDLKDTKAQKEAFMDTWSNVSYKDTLEQIKDIDLDLYTFLESLDKIRVPKSAVSYLTTMAIRIWYIHKVLKDSGSFYLHCDPTMSHFLKILCDLIFGSKNFRNEIVWCYSIGGRSSQAFPQKHDVIFFYSKTGEYYFNKKGFTVPRKPNSHMRVVFDEHGRPCQEKTDKKTGKVYRYPVDDGKTPEDWWIIEQLNREDKERLGYPTQKPEKLLERIVKTSSKEGDLVADFFCGCGTTIAVAQQFNRKWIGVDISHLAIGLVERKRLLEPYGKSIKGTYEIDGLPKDIASAKKLAQDTLQGRFKFQDWIIETMLGGIHNPKKVADGGWDGYLTFALEKSKKEVVLVEVKSGKVGVKDIRQFINVVDSQKASIGVFICFKDEVTKPMLEAAKDQGYYRRGSTDTFKLTPCDKIQILTVEDLLEGKYINLPSTYTTFKEAGKKDLAEQQALL